MLVIDSWVPVINQLFGLKQGRKIEKRESEREKRKRERLRQKHTVRERER